MEILFRTDRACTSNQILEEALGEIPFIDDSRSPHLLFGQPPTMGCTIEGDQPSRGMRPPLDIGIEYI